MQKQNARLLLVIALIGEIGLWAGSVAQSTEFFETEGRRKNILVENLKTMELPCVGIHEDEERVRDYGRACLEHAWYQTDCYTL